MDMLGVHFHLLTDHEIAHTELSKFDTIVIGPKAYYLRGELRENAYRFLDYVKQGGRLIVQYQWYGYDNAQFVPYPLKLQYPVDRVTDENAPIRILKPDSPLFHYPNKISLNDFSAWVHDRGISFFSQWDSAYETFLSCSDPGEPQQEGGLIGCKYGKGCFIYCGYSLFRQIPAGVPGAFRLFFNLLTVS